MADPTEDTPQSEEERMAAEWASMAGEEAVDDEKVAAEWEAMTAGAETDSGMAAPQADRVLDQDEIDSLLGFDGDDEDGNSRSGVQALINSGRSEEHTSELQSLMRISYAVFCLKKKQQAIQK